MADWRTDDRELLARILTAEAGNQGPVGMTAAGNVIMNRAGRTGYGEGVRGVIMKPGQFSPMNSVTGYASGEQGQNIDSLRPSDTAYMVADSLLQGTAGDITGGATHFFNPDISNPSWAQGKEFKRIGDHVFGNADAGRGTTQSTGPMTGSNQPQRTGAPMGLLDTQPAQQPEQQKSGFWNNFAGGLLADPDRRAKIGIALEGMTLNPNRGLIQNLQSGIDTRKEQAVSNRTIEWLRSQGRDDLADAVASGSLDGKTAAATLFNKDATEGVVVDNKLINKRTGEVIYQPNGGPSFDVEKVQSARKEFTGLPQVKAFADQTTAYGTLISSVTDPSPAGDLSLIFNYMKILDPGSTVREGEFATAQDSGSIDDRTRGLYNRIVNGERLSERQRSDFADRATRIYSSAEQQYNSFAEQYGRFAQAAGLPTEQVIPDYSFVGNRYQTPLIYQLPPPPQGVTQQDWTDAWNNMTDAQRQTFLNNSATP